MTQNAANDRTEASISTDSHWEDTTSTESKSNQRLRSEINKHLLRCTCVASRDEGLELREGHRRGRAQNEAILCPEGEEYDVGSQVGDMKRLQDDTASDS